MLTMGITNWARLFQQCYDNLQPGGWVETGDIQPPFGSVENLESNDAPFIRWVRGPIAIPSFLSVAITDFSVKERVPLRRR